MILETKYAVHPEDVRNYDTDRLRKEFLTEGLMQNDSVKLIYTHYDRYVYGGVIPTKPLALPDGLNEFKSSFFLERRELGILNIGGKGKVKAGGKEYTLNTLDMMYIGMGTKGIEFSSESASDPAKFYINSCPAHKEYPTVVASQKEANQVHLGARESANERTIFQYIHEDGIQSCQLVMGFTEMKSGSIWNTFPPHTHERRMEVYFYFDLPDDQLVIHFMGQPQQTRHLTMKNHDAVVSPPWSIHSGAGTIAYKFAWGMAGENKAFTDMDGVSLKNLK